ncbi:MAG: hypothetical protein UY31_C0010G0005 [Candidatus Wolfebacteria bacterium GW2011_GWE1_48_7]|uniref:Putative 3-methyladenine DNA glycosylase n=2 Tax=Candidatus Wolfeibacteriota TaxID=1752735 RepID=A0A0G1X7U7_9BACT|nr:MAG: 3-methyladenine DNA glycosylase, DNA-3-methyladenine glycosylase [Candidatus Wolfebacteria bacterium GW2011_GWB1_47_1]KKU37151.1 MAG: hypothetical protein UX49_C0001G0021 [Candidatus Wolfebacteria bacterium GW2011_GWC2_46_275]KKU42689.1 MAG: hypothetical protein UX58_C0001G0121 [Candidatus Wolfebacteria bacterium GW2011_GWB2_46_69]KKU54576.1 MAG: hypothetical protein UX76_C0001G0035 [Candidatus Wolfebacteria bacterium GW2011_GWC1_47_103]KKU59960.1 MAG: hypothetical protein UX83_C0001G00
MHRPIPHEFFDREALIVAQDLLGKFLVREYNDHAWSLMVTEVETYDGPEDRLSPAYGGRKDHNETLFAKAGSVHISQRVNKETLTNYFTATEAIDSARPILHIVTGPKDYPAAILIRSALVMLPTGEIEHIQGPAELTRFLKIGKEFDGTHATKESGLWFEDRDVSIPAEHIIKRKRIGAEHAEEWSDLEYNFSIIISQNKSLT